MFAAGTQHQLYSSWGRLEEGATEAPASGCVSQKAQMGSVSQKRKSKDWQLLCCAEPCQTAEEGTDGAWHSARTGDQLAKASEKMVLFFPG